MKKRMTGFLALYTALLTALFLLLFPTEYPAAGAAGSGTSESPYLISSEPDLRAIYDGAYNNNNSAHYRLQNDIVLSDTNWEPIGTFSGLFDGDGYTISNLQGAGLFDEMSGTVKNLRLSAIINTAGTYAGTLAQKNSGNVENCHADFTIINESYSNTTVFYTGGLIGFNTGNVSRCSAEGSISLITREGLSYAGGLIGYSRGAEIKDCWAKAEITNNSTNGHTGGLIGNMENGTAQRCYTVLKPYSSAYTGGLFGSISGKPVFAMCYYDTTDLYQDAYYVGVTPLTRGESKNRLKYVGFDFDNSWSIDPYINDGYPYLRQNGAHTFAISGTGTAADPYLIENESQLTAVSTGDLPSNAHYMLQNDIALNAKIWFPIGQNDEFTGVFDGGGYTISNINITTPSYAGFFARTAGTIKNLGLSAVIKSSTNYAGALAGQNNGTVENCSAAVSIENTSTGQGSGSYYIGGLVGENYSSGAVLRCSVTGNIEFKIINEHSYRYAGGLIGYNYGSAQDCGARVSLYNETRTSSSYIGGLIGYANRGTVTRCYAAGSTGQNSGGLIGYVGSCTLSFNYYDMTGLGNTTGVMGITPLTAQESKDKSMYIGWDFDNNWAIDPYINDGYPYLRPNGSHGSTIKGSGTAGDPYLIETESHLSSIGGELPLDGHYRLENNITIVSRNWVPIGYGNYFSGVFDGSGYTISLTNEGLFSYTSGVIKNLGVRADITSNEYHTGALADYNTGIIENCFADAKILHSGRSGLSYTGVLTGYSSGSIRRCYTTGSVTYDSQGGESCLGGLIGGSEHHGNVIEDCWSSASVTNNSNNSASCAGGLIGVSGKSYDVTVKRCYASGKVTGGYNTGGIIGLMNSYIITTLFNYFDTTATGQTGSVKDAVYLTSAQAKDKSFYVGWDFENNWDIDPNINNGYPYLRDGGCHSAPQITGTGTAPDPYLIENEQQLAALSGGELPINARYKLTRDIELKSNSWLPIGSSWDSEPFSGVFDGAGHTISGLRISSQCYTYGYAGLFGMITGTVHDLGVIAEIATNDRYAGALTAYNSGTLRNCFTHGTVNTVSREPNGVYAGGLVGYNYGTVEDCMSDAAVTGEFDGTKVYAGGLIGYVGTGTVKRSYAAGRVTGRNAGGLTGGAVTAAVMVFNYYDREATGQNDTNKGAYRLSGTEARDKLSYTGFDFENNWTADPNINGGYPYHIQGGQHIPPDIKGAGIESNPYLIENERQLIALAGGESEIYAAHLSFFVLARDIKLTAKFWTPIGGNGQPAFSGVFDGNGYTISNVSIPQPRFTNSGLFGEIAGGVVGNLGVTSVNIEASGSAGAITGLLASDGITAGYLIRCYSNGMVNCSGNAGGLAGRVNAGGIDTCYSRADVASVTSRAGGLAGYVETAALVENSYAAGEVSGITSGGIIGAIDAGTAIFNENYFDRTVTKQTDSNKGARGFTTSQIKDAQNLPNWDFVNTWIISPLYNDGYPYLRVFMRAPEQIETPTANPPGGSVVEGTTVALHCETEAASIYYTTDGSTPTGQSMLYTQPIVVETDVTIRALAVCAGMLDSDVAAFTYTVIITQERKPEFDGNTWLIPADHRKAVTLTFDGWLIDLVFAENYDEIHYMTGESIFTVFPDAAPFNTIIKLVNADRTKTRYIGVEKPVKVSAGTTFDGTTWVIPPGIPALMELKSWQISSVFSDAPEGTLAVIDNSIAVSGGTQHFKAIIKLRNLSGVTKYIGMERS